MTPLEEFKKNLEEIKPKLEKILKGDADKFIQIAANYVEQNAGLLEKDRTSLYAEIMKAAQAGLYIDGQESALVPFKGRIKIMVMYKGLLKQVRNSGELASINCGVAYEKDVFEFFVDEAGEHIKHVPVLRGERGLPSITYAIARTKDSSAPYIEIMREEEINDCKKQSRAGNDSPWNGAFADEMRKKTVIRRISKRLPMATDLNAAIHADDDLFIPPEDDPAESAPAKETSSSLLEAVKSQPEKTAVTNTSMDAGTKDTPIEPTKKGEYKEGVIEELKIFDVTLKGNPTKRYGCRIGSEWFGTFDIDIYKEMCDAADNAANVWLIYEVKAKKSSGEKYNEALGVKFVESSDDNIPI